MGIGGDLQDRQGYWPSGVSGTALVSNYVIADCDLFRVSTSSSVSEATESISFGTSLDKVPVQISRNKSHEYTQSGA